MIVLDTNVVSEWMKSAPSASVQAWLNAQTIETLYLTSVTQAEMWFGIRLFPAGRRRDLFEDVLREMLGWFDGRILPFDTEAARHYADMAVVARRQGRGFPTPDGYIAATAASRGFIVATRDASPFAAAGVTVVDPWQEGARG